MHLPEIIRTIHPQDSMWQPGESWYFAAGRSALRLVDLAVRASWLPSVTSILDLPCGHGRVGRYLRAAYPEAELFFCDIEKSGADFCAETFGGTAIHSRPELTEVALPKVDIIWVGSLFTHVDQERMQRWLRYLCGHLNQDGMLIATFHGEWSLRMQDIYPMIDAGNWQRIVDQYRREGYGYAPYPNAANHAEECVNAQDYGISLCHPHRLLEAIRDIPDVRLAGYMERGWADNHDVAIIAKDDRDRPWTPGFRNWNAAAMGSD